MAKKTLKKWEKSGLNRNEYLSVGDEIDEAMFLDISECVSPEYSDETFVQNGEASNTLRIPNFQHSKIYFHGTAIKTISGKFYYLGDLPSFNQLELHRITS